MSGPAFARHETFHPRYGWLKKGFDEARQDPEVFLADDAHIRLGVGKNMVRAIRYWTHAFGVLEYDHDSAARSKSSRPSDFGLSLLSDDGFDPFLEDLGSLWLLHWRLLNGDEATAWKWAFFEYARPEVTAAELVKVFQQFVQRDHPDFSVAASSLKKDASCILRMYGDLAVGRITEETIHCPFAELGLIGPGDSTRSLAFRIGAKAGLSHELLMAMCLEYAGHRGAARTVALPVLLHGENSPGLAFKLNETAMYHALEVVVGDHPKLGLSDVAGIIQLSFPAEVEQVQRELIETHYGRLVGWEAVA